MISISDYLEEDHNQIDDHLHAASYAAEHGEWSTAEYQLKQFLTRLDRHIDAEELTLFPAVEGKTGPLPPCQVMRDEHTEIRVLMSRLPEAVQARDAAAFQAARERLTGFLGQHNMKEENILYPMADEVLGEEAPALVVQLKRELTPAPSGSCGCDGQGGCQG